MKKKIAAIVSCLIVALTFFCYVPSFAASNQDINMTNIIWISSDNSMAFPNSTIKIYKIADEADTDDSLYNMNKVFTAASNDTYLSRNIVLGLVENKSSVKLTELASLFQETVEKIDYPEMLSGKTSLGGECSFKLEPGLYLATGTPVTIHGTTYTPYASIFCVAASDQAVNVYLKYEESNPETTTETEQPTTASTYHPSRESGTDQILGVDNTEATMLMIIALLTIGMSVVVIAVRRHKEG